MKRYLLASLLLLPIVACSSDDPVDPVAPGGCSDEVAVNGVCTGVPQGVSLDDSGIACNNIIDVAGPDALDSATSAAAAGDCIRLAPGAYGTVTLADGVSLLSSHPNDTSVAGVFAGGTNDYSPTIRGVHVNEAGVVLSGGEVMIDAVRVSASPAAGIEIEAGRVKISRSEILGAKGVAVQGVNVDGIDISASRISGAEGGGVWEQGEDTCNTPDNRVDFDLTDSIIEDSMNIGIASFGGTGRLDNLVVRRMRPNSGFTGGAGMAFAACSAYSGGRLTIVDNTDYGVLVDDSDLDVDGMDVQRNFRGVWVQNVVSGALDRVVLRNAQLIGNKGVGFGMSGGSSGISVEDVAIDGTEKVNVPVLIDGVSAGVEDVGEGITWTDQTQARLTNVVITNSAIKSMTITDEVGAGSIVTDMRLEAGDETLGILHQDLPAGGVTPEWRGTMPFIEQSTEQIQGVPRSPAIPPGI